jgi:hypothetical protein
VASSSAWRVCARRSVCVRRPLLAVIPISMKHEGTYRQP